jgi:hypothetical protein
MTADLLADSIRGCRHSAFRLETRQQYAVGDEADVLAAFLATGHRQPRTVRDDDYVRLVAEHVLAGRERARVHIVSRPLCGYLRYELAVYRDFFVAGEQILIADSDANSVVASLREDFWLIDEGHPTERAILLAYDEDGAWQGCSLAPPDRLAELREAKETALLHSKTLHAFMADQEVIATA